MPPACGADPVTCPTPPPPPMTQSPQCFGQRRLRHPSTGIPNFSASLQTITATKQNSSTRSSPSSHPARLRNRRKNIPSAYPRSSPTFIVIGPTSQRLPASLPAPQHSARRALILRTRPSLRQMQHKRPKQLCLLPSQQQAARFRTYPRSAAPLPPFEACLAKLRP